MALKLLDAATSTGTGTATVLQRPARAFTCTVTWGGTTPTNTVVYLEGSINGTNYGTLASETVTSSGTVFHVADKPVSYIRGNYVSRSGGDATTAVTLSVSALIEG